MSSNNKLDRLSQPDKIKDVVSRQNDEYEDCTPCRLMGSAAFTGMGIYTFYSGHRQIQEREREILRSGSRFGPLARKWAIGGLSAALVGAGVFRLFN